MTMAGDVGSVVDQRRVQGRLYRAKMRKALLVQLETAATVGSLRDHRERVVEGTLGVAGGQADHPHRSTVAGILPPLLSVLQVDLTVARSPCARILPGIRPSSTIVTAASPLSSLLLLLLLLNVLRVDLLCNFCEHIDDAFSRLGRRLKKEQARLVCVRFGLFLRDCTQRGRRGG